MPRSIAYRLQKLEESLGNLAECRWEHSLEQLAKMSYGDDPGPPSLFVKKGETSLGDLIRGAYSNTEKEDRDHPSEEK